ncbi:unnamed protein product, partial [Prorocentrum cordatum]
ACHVHGARPAAPCRRCSQRSAWLRPVSGPGCQLGPRGEGAALGSRSGGAPGPRRPRRGVASWRSTTPRARWARRNGCSESCASACTTGGPTGVATQGGNRGPWHIDVWRSWTRPATREAAARARQRRRRGERGAVQLPRRLRAACPGARACGGLGAHGLGLRGAFASVAGPWRGRPVQRPQRNVCVCAAGRRRG